MTQCITLFYIWAAACTR